MYVCYVCMYVCRSSQGALLQMIEFSQQSATGDVRETGLALSLLFIFALLASGYVCMYVGYVYVCLHLFVCMNVYVCICMYAYKLELAAKRPISTLYKRFVGRISFVCMYVCMYVCMFV